MTELKRPYVDLTSWVKALWDAINELRRQAETDNAIIHDQISRINRLEEAVGNGI